MTSSNECQGPGEGDTAFWAGRKHADDLTEIFNHVLDAPEGVSLAYLVQCKYSSDDVSSASAAYQRVRRFILDAEDRGLFKIDRRGRSLWVEPTPEAYRRSSLDTASKQSIETQDGSGLDSKALSNARGILSRRQTFDDAAAYGDLVGAFGAKRKGAEGRYRCYENTFTGERSFIPLKDRFNSEQRVKETRQRLRMAFRRAAQQGHEQAMVTTLTTDPARFSNLEEACESLLDDVNRLKDWLERTPQNGPTRVGHRPPTIVIPEFTDHGVPHIHLVMFGVGWVAEHGELSRYWGWEQYRDRGDVVWIDQLHARDGQWRWGRSSDERSHPETRGRTPYEYLSKGVNALETSAALNADEIHEIAASLRNDADPATVENAPELIDAALYWATGLSVFTCSPSLREPSEDDQGQAQAPDGTLLPDDAPSCWQYIGTARLAEFPAHILSRSSGSRRPSPPEPPPDRAE